MRHPDFLTRSTRRRLSVSGGAAVAALALVGLAACTSSGGSDTTGTVGAVGSGPMPTATLPPSTDASGSPSATSASPSSTPATTPSGGTGAPAGADQGASGLPTCQPAQTTIRIEAGQASAGHVGLRLVVSNTGTTPCVTQGYAGVSFVAPGTGKQIGAPADRAPVVPSPLIRLEPGKTAVALILVAQAANYGPTCDLTQAAGFRVYLPGTTSAAYVPYAVDACAAASVHQLSIQAFTI
ncbi:DUF4232 domain-containing protein [Dermatophilaceae bacterium Soc4.6]